MSKQYVNRMTNAMDTADQTVEETWGKREGGNSTRAAAMIDSLHQTMQAQASQEGVSSIFLPSQATMIKIFYPSVTDIAGVVVHSPAMQNAIDGMNIDITRNIDEAIPFKNKLEQMRGAAVSSSSLAASLSTYLVNDKIALLSDCITRSSTGPNYVSSSDGLNNLIASINTDGFLGWVNFFHDIVTRINADTNLSESNRQELITMVEKADNAFFALASEYSNQLRSHPDILAYREHQLNIQSDMELLSDPDAMDRRIRSLRERRPTATGLAKSFLEERIEWLTNARTEILYQRYADFRLKLNAISADIRVAQNGENPTATPFTGENQWAHDEYTKLFAELQRIARLSDAPTQIVEFHKEIEKKIQETERLKKALEPKLLESQDRKTQHDNLSRRRVHAQTVLGLHNASQTLLPLRQLVEAFADQDKTKIGEYTREIWLSRGASLMFAALGTTVAALGTEMMIAGGIASATHAEFGTTLGHTLADPGALAHGVQNLAANDPAILVSIILASVIGVGIIAALCKLADDKLANRYNEKSVETMKVIEVKVAEAKIESATLTRI